jgi:hypothetical protein
MLIHIANPWIRKDLDLQIRTFKDSIQGSQNKSGLKKIWFVS